MCALRSPSLCYFKFVVSTLFNSLGQLCLVWSVWFCVSPLLGDKQGFEFRGVMSVNYTHFIPSLWLVFFMFLLY